MILFIALPEAKTTPPWVILLDLCRGAARFAGSTIIGTDAVIRARDTVTNKSLEVAGSSTVRQDLHDSADWLLPSGHLFAMPATGLRTHRRR